MIPLQLKTAYFHRRCGLLGAPFKVIRFISSMLWRIIYVIFHTLQRQSFDNYCVALQLSDIDTCHIYCTSSIFPWSHFIISKMKESDPFLILRVQSDYQCIPFLHCGIFVRIKARHFWLTKMLDLWLCHIWCERWKVFDNN